MTRHRETHDAETEKSDFSHVYNLEFAGGVELTGHMLEKGGARASPKAWEAHNKGCRMKGNAPFAGSAWFCANLVVWKFSL
jgi:hypothetical protein